MGRRWGVSCAAVVMMVSMNVVAAGPSGAMSATQLRGDALTLRQMPAGWFTHAPVGDPRLGCLAHLLEPAKVNETNYLEVYFVAKSDLPFVVETLTTYSSTASAFSKIASRLASCRSISGDLDGYRVTGTVRIGDLDIYEEASPVVIRRRTPARHTRTPCPHTRLRHLPARPPRQARRHPSHSAPRRRHGHHPPRHSPRRPATSPRLRPQIRCVTASQRP